MELPKYIDIKQEEEDIEDNYVNLFDFYFDVQVKSEEPEIEDFDWCIQNNTVILDNKDVYGTSDNCDQLGQDCKRQCSICDNYLENSYTLLEHNLTHLVINLTKDNNFCNYQCCGCNIYYKSEKELQKHLIKHEEIINRRKTRKLKIFHCEDCDKVYTYKTWKSHMRDVHRNPEYSCDICKSLFKCERYLRRHVIQKHGGVQAIKKCPNTDFKCDKCPAVLKNGNALKTHIRNCHTEKAICDICNSELKCKTYLQAHLKRVHYDDGKKYKCNLCHKKFKSPRYLKIHKKNSHTGVKLASKVKKVKKVDTNEN